MSTIIGFIPAKKETAKAVKEKPAKKETAKAVKEKPAKKETAKAVKETTEEVVEETKEEE